MIPFIDDHWEAYGVEPICNVLPIAPSTYHAHAARRRNHDLAPAREMRDRVLALEVRRVFEENFSVYGVRKVWRQLRQEGFDLARCTVARLNVRHGVARDYRHHSKSKIMTLATDEFIRRFLLHTLPDGFHRIRHYGFFANGHRAEKLALCRTLLAAPPPGNASTPARDAANGRSLDRCPCCGGAMIPLGALPRSEPLRPPFSQRRKPDTDARACRLRPLCPTMPHRTHRGA